MLCGSPLARGLLGYWGADELALSTRKGILMRTGLVRGRAELHMGWRSVCWFPKGNGALNVSFPYHEAISVHYRENRNYR